MSNLKKLYTSYYARSGKNDRAISISAKAPFFYKGNKYLDLAPSWELLRAYKSGEIDNYQYTQIYGENLKARGITPQVVVTAIPENSIMLCYEGPGKFCHRHIVAVWLNNSGLAEVCEVNKDGSAAPPTTVDDLLKLLETPIKL